MMNILHLKGAYMAKCHQKSRTGWTQIQIQDDANLR